MPKHFQIETIQRFSAQLDRHPVYEALHTLEDLRCFMQHHIFSVWDFMSLIKYLQKHVAPAEYPWLPRASGSVRYFINSLVLEEESDKALPTQTQDYTSHFELYCQTMREVGADPEPALHFLDVVKQVGIEQALESQWIPEPSRQFTRTTFAFIHSDKPHVVAAALALGREHVIPNMFRGFLAQMAITEQEAPAFHYYLKRHIHLDEDFHAPLSLQLLNELCGKDEEKYREAEETAQQAITARLHFWDAVLQAIQCK